MYCHILHTCTLVFLMNDLPSVSNLFMPVRISDDTSLLCTGNDAKDLDHQINEDIAKIYDRVNANKSFLNIHETFCSSRQ